ncbi:GL23475 [Drosophila persimilis]|uniref:GL23475 n=1 Tax=Drosophila persimilis TaxID=7234 RepID=B4G3C7_DROPE|nr:putative aminopeptidase W07G4.4 [Drosophila persimilis]XP_017143013.1 putative aminopeptidase W07G4.4 [Drosophila miranda]XP_017143014.1 putative aminopeptidase W07G4.4 [Drosophila miranda]XP_017143016.1 putative aminopeptidase W07G4.4 [Drosophila miranda]XP_026844353.1 putative aminopeptidase W07G4.4 [Drosophila persimilis]XP_026844731.1 putative aminopeptidase W07G4.4 [Drosophila persimilis]XP_033246121.1 putative aminopeptidase W07G4.4 [Drosophila miranda]XP_033246122.1 putative aminop
MGIEKFVPCTLRLNKLMKGSGTDCVCVIDQDVLPTELKATFDEHRSFDKSFDSSISCFRAANVEQPVVYAPVGDLNDYDDVRSYQEAAKKSMQKVLKAGFNTPLLFVPKVKRFPQAELCTVLGALEQLYVPIHLREAQPGKDTRVTTLNVQIDDPKADEILREALILEAGRYVARDIGGGDPERMAPSQVEKYVKNLFDKLSMNVISDSNTLQKDYPLFAAVNRAADVVERHRGRIIFLEYKPPKPARKTLMLVGKGVTYDTGGADIKAGGVMAGMSRDKCGAAAVAGFMKVVNEIKPEDIHVVAALCMVRNSVGEECYVADEIITSRAGLLVRIGNTDAEGRMCMTDALCRMKEMAVEQSLPDPHLFTIATLTGHAFISAGEGQSIAIDNSVAHQADHARKLQAAGQTYGEPFEVSVLRPSDFAFNAGKVIGEDLVQANNAPSVRTPRGHQVPAAFMIMASGLDKHGINAKVPLKYTHIDIAGSAGEYPAMPTAAPLVSLVKTHLLG